MKPVLGFGIVIISAFGLNLHSSEFSHVVIIPDIHGDAFALLRSLWLAVKKIDGTVPEIETFKSAFAQFVGTLEYSGPLLAARWEKPVLAVQLGDVVDRGPYGIESLCYLAGIEKILGWKFVQLYGNHEIMNFLGEADSYIHPKEWKLFPSRADRMTQFAVGGAARTHITQTSLGLMRLNAEGTASTLFVHGGINLEWIQRELGIRDDNIEAINEKISELAKSSNNTQVDLLNDDESLLWTRDLAEEPEHVICGKVWEICRHFKVTRIVMGHTPQTDFLAKTRCGGQIVLTDVMMSRWMVTREVNEMSGEGGRPVAIIMNLKDGHLGSIVAHYTDLLGGLEAESVLERNPTLGFLPYHPSSYLYEDDYDADDFDDDDSDEDSEDESSEGDEDMDNDDSPQLGHLLGVTGTHTAVFESSFIGHPGLTNIFLDNRSIDEAFLHKVAASLNLPIPLIGTISVPPILASSRPVVPFLFVKTDCTTPLRERAFSRTLIENLVDRLRFASIRLNTNGLSLGFRDPDEVVSAFTVCDDGRSLFLSDWSRIRETGSSDGIRNDSWDFKNLLQRLLQLAPT
jgi:hypothetical protein